MTNSKVAPRFELGDNGFAIHGLTTWLCHHIARSYLTLKAETLETLENNLSLGVDSKLTPTMHQALALR